MDTLLTAARAFAHGDFMYVVKATDSDTAAKVATAYARVLKARDAYSAMEAKSGPYTIPPPGSGGERGERREVADELIAAEFELSKWRFVALWEKTSVPSVLCRIPQM